MSRDFGLQLIFQEERGRVPWLESTTSPGEYPDFNHWMRVNTLKVEPDWKPTPPRMSWLEFKLIFVAERSLAD